MKAQYWKFPSFLLIVVLLAACGSRAGTTPEVSPPTAVPVTPTTAPPTATATEVPLPSLSITLGETNDAQGIVLDSGGDVDTKAESIGSPPIEVRTSGNGEVLSASGDNTPDSYLQFNVDDKQLSNGKPTSHVRLEVDYFDQGTDTFMLEYDAASGTFVGGGSIVKTNTQTLKTATFNLCDAKFANRDNGADFRLSDNGDGADSIHAVRVIGLPSAGAQTVNVDDHGANPFDDQPDSDAIQGVLDSSCSGDTIVFTSGVNDPSYKGYLIDKTLFLTGMSAKRDLIFTSSDPNNHALLQATVDLKGFVVKLYARSRFSNGGDVDNIDFGNIDVNGGRDVRMCSGADGKEDGNGDNWGSWLPECDVSGDPYCAAGSIDLGGAVDQNDSTQNYEGSPSLWTTGIRIHDVVDSQTECATALYFGSAAGTIENVTIDTSGDHVHEAGCSYTDNDGDPFGWGDGMTVVGPAQTITNNMVINPSDVGIVFFGGKDTVISNNIVKVTQGNYGAFAGIGLHPWQLGDISGVQITGNNVSSEGDTQCGGIHAGINLGPQMWGGGFVNTSSPAAFGNNGPYSEHPSPDKVAACTGGQCQIWAYLPSDGTLTLKDNTVTGAHLNYFIEGLDALGTFVDENNVSVSPQLSDWDAAKRGCKGVTWSALDKVAHDPSLPGYTDLVIHCER